MKKKIGHLTQNKFSDLDGLIYQVKVGLPGEWSIISWRLSSRPGLEPPELELEPATFRQALGLAFALRSANFMVGPPTVTPKLLTFFVKGLWLLIRTENMLDQVVVSILVRTCLVSVQKRNHHFDFTNFFACQHLFLIFTKLARYLWLIFFVKTGCVKTVKWHHWNSTKHTEHAVVGKVLSYFILSLFNEKSDVCFWLRGRETTRWWWSGLSQLRGREKKGARARFSFESRADWERCTLGDMTHCWPSRENGQKLCLLHWYLSLVLIHIL